MPDSSLTLEMLIKEGKAVIGLNNVAQAETRVEQGASKIAKEAKRAEAELERFAKRTTQINATPLERYATQVQRLDTVLARGKITHETYGRAVARARGELEAAGRAQDDALGPTALGQITQFAAGYLTLGAAVRLVGDAFRHARQESDEALGSLRGVDDQRRKLAQLATDMGPGALTGMTRRADAAAMASGASRQTAYEVLFQAHSFGFEKDYEQVMGMHPIIDALAASSIAGKVATMTGKQHSPRQLVNMLIEAGKPSEVDAETLAGPMAIALEGGRRIGGSAEQTAALLSAMTKYYAGRGETQGEGKSGAARVAGDRMRAFAHKVATRLPDIAGQKPDFVGAFEAVRGLHEADRAEFLQENEEISSAYEAYLAAREEAQATLAKITRAGAAPASRDNVALGLQQRLGDPASRAAIEMNRAEIAKTVSREGALGVQSAGAATAQARAEQAGYNAGLNMFEQAAVTGASETARTMRASGGQTTFLSGIGVMAGGQLSGDVNQFGFWRWVGQIIGQSFADEVSKNNLLPAGNTSGVGRGVSAAAQAPLN